MKTDVMAIIGVLVVVGIVIVAYVDEVGVVVDWANLLPLGAVLALLVVVVIVQIHKNR